VLALAGVLVVGGCGLSGNGSTDASSGPASVSAGSTTAAAGSPSPSPSDSSEPPVGAVWATATGTGVRFAVPEEWSVIDPSALLEQGDADALASAAESLGISPDQMKGVADQVDLLVMGPPEKDFAPNVNVVPNPVAEMPGDAALKADLGTIGAKVSDIRPATTPLGDAKVVSYRLPMGATTVRGRAIVAETPDGFTTITVSHVDDKDADAIAAQVLETLGTA
jgi:hypothetical protein